MSTSTDDNASTSPDGFMLSISGQAMAPTPIAAPAPATSLRKSRLPASTPSWAKCAVSDPCVLADIDRPSFSFEAGPL